MSNPLYMQMNQSNNSLLNQFNQFRNSFKGDPKQKVQELLNSGRISQAQYNKAVQMANNMRKMLGI